MMMVVILLLSFSILSIKVKGSRHLEKNSKGNPVTPMSHLYTVGARVESAWRYNLREVVLRKRNYCAEYYLRLMYWVTVVFIGFFCG